MLDLSRFSRDFFYQLEIELNTYFAGGGKGKNIRDFFADYTDQMLADLREQLWVMLRDMSNFSKQEMRKAAAPILKGFTHFTDKTEKDILFELRSKADFTTIKNRIKSRTGVAEHIARTLTDTGQSCLNNVKTMNDYIEAGFTHFTYSGPSAERKFCRMHLGQTYSLDEIMKLSNGTGNKGKTELPVLFYLGGYNCKHFWQPVWAVPEKATVPVRGQLPNTIAGWENYAKEKLGFVSIDHAITNPEALGLAFKRIEQLKSKYKLEKLTVMRNETRPRAWASANFNRINLNAKHFNDLEALRASVKHSIAVGYHPRGCEAIESIIDHEAAHTMTIMELYNKTGLYNEIKKIKTAYTKEKNQLLKKQKEILSKKGAEYVYFDGFRFLQTDYKSGKISREDFLRFGQSYGYNSATAAQIDDLENKIDAIHVSDYANESIDEFAAECFAMGLNCDTPSPYAKKVFDLIEQKYKRGE